jgi:hypothetical protein
MAFFAQPVEMQGNRFVLSKRTLAGQVNMRNNRSRSSQ